MNEIVICPHCNKNEYHGEMTWLEGSTFCRSCYKNIIQIRTMKPYKWDDKNYSEEELKELGRVV